MKVSISIFIENHLLLATVIVVIIAGLIHCIYSVSVRNELPSWAKKVWGMIQEGLHRMGWPYYLFLDDFELALGKRSWFWTKPHLHMFHPRDIFIFISLEELAEKYMDEVHRNPERQIGGLKRSLSSEELFVEIPVHPLNMTKKETKFVAAMSRKAKRNGWEMTKREPGNGQFLRYKFSKKRLSKTESNNA